MDHYAILEGHDLMLFFIVYALVLALLLVMVYDLLTHLAEIISRRRRFLILPNFDPIPKPPTLSDLDPGPLSYPT
eukprot:1754604-Rhodomonas_salina.1